MKSSLAVVALILTATFSHAADPIAKQDADFLRKAAIGGMAEVQAAEVALKRGTLSPEERTFAQQMVDDHGKVNAELKKLAADKGVTVPTTLDEDAQKMSEKLASAKDADFPARYLKAQIADHKDAVSLFKEESEDGKDGDVKAFATKHLPHLRAHLETAKALHDKR